MTALANNNMRRPIFSAVFFAAFLFCAVAPAAAQIAPADPGAVSGAAAESTAPQRPPSILSAVMRAKKLLAAELAKRAAKTSRTVKSKSDPVDVVLAVWNRDTDAIRFVNAVRSGTKLALKADPGFPISVAGGSGVAVRYSVPPESRSVIVGAITPLFVETRVKRQKLYRLRDTVYVPYASDFYTPEVLSAGSDYLSYLIQDAFDELRRKRVKSRVFPDRLVADVIDPYLIKSVVVIEHSSERSLLGGDSERAVGLFFVNLATNGEDAFDSANSSAGAVGLVQFIPSTYKRLAKNRTDLGLIADFSAGMSDHKNAIMAEVAYLDESLASMPRAVRDLYVSDKVKAAEFLAAAYNGGPTRVRRAFALWGPEWTVSRRTETARLESRASELKTEISALKRKLQKVSGKKAETIKTSLAKATKARATTIGRLAEVKKGSLREETVGYVAKLRKVYSMFTSGQFATPNAPSGALPIEEPRIAAAASSATDPVICFDDGGCAR